MFDTLGKNIHKIQISVTCNIDGGNNANIQNNKSMIGQKYDFSYRNYEILKVRQILFVVG